MKEDEKKFFRLCYRYIRSSNQFNIKTYTPGELINILDEWLPHKRAWYYLSKWDRLGFYEWGVTEDLGWFILDKIPQRYLDLLKENLK